MEFEEFCQKFNIEKIQDSQFFEEAITHSSVSKKKNYERLELLGDAILNFVISEILFFEFPEKKEGELAKLKGFLISAKICNMVAQEIGLHKIYKIHSIQIKDNVILANIMEALIALIYIEEGIEKIFEIIKNLFLKYLDNFEEDSKMKLQEFCQKTFQCLPHYNMLKKSGSEHEPTFSIEVSIGNKKEIGVGKNKKEAEKIAAKKLLEKLI